MSGTRLFCPLPASAMHNQYKRFAPGRDLDCPLSLQRASGAFRVASLHPSPHGGSGEEKGTFYFFALIQWKAKMVSLEAVCVLICVHPCSFVVSRFSNPPHRGSNRSLEIRPPLLLGKQLATSDSPLALSPQQSATTLPTPRRGHAETSLSLSLHSFSLNAPADSFPNPSIALAVVRSPLPFIPRIKKPPAKPRAL